MDTNPYIELQPSSVLHIPFHKYQQNFTFIVNDEKFHTSRFIADLLSPKISHFHQIDPTINEYSIITNNKGDFSNILELSKFNRQSISYDSILFYAEIFENLETSPKDIKFKILDPNKPINDIFFLIQNYQKIPIFYSDQIASEIEKIAENFFMLKGEEKNKFEELPKEMIELVISNQKLQLESEDQLIEIINDLYSNNEENCELYSYVYFPNVSNQQMANFVNIISIDDITRETWISLSERLCSENDTQSDEKHKNRYKAIEKVQHKKNVKKEIPYNNRKFEGILNYFNTQSNVNEEIEITSSSLASGYLMSLLQFNNDKNYVYTRDESNSWICFEFKKCEVIPSNYTIKTSFALEFGNHLRNWVLEGSSDQSSWTLLDEQSNCSFLNGSLYSYTFSIKNENQQSFKYLRIRQNGPTWANEKFLIMKCIEFYGKIIEI